MIHDDACELAAGHCVPCNQYGWQRHCHCASRACPLCLGCRNGKHLAHADIEPSTGKRCACDLCEMQEAS